MYQIYKRTIGYNHAHSKMTPIEDEFFMSRKRAQSRINELTANTVGFIFREVIGENDEGDQIQDDITYHVDHCYVVRELFPRDAPRDELPF